MSNLSHAIDNSLDVLQALRTQMNSIEEIIDTVSAPEVKTKLLAYKSGIDEKFKLYCNSLSTVILYTKD